MSTTGRTVGPLMLRPDDQAAEQQRGVHVLGVQEVAEGAVLECHVQADVRISVEPLTLKPQGSPMHWPKAVRSVPEHPLPSGPRGAQRPAEARR